MLHIPRKSCNTFNFCSTHSTINDTERLKVKSSHLEYYDFKYWNMQISLFYGYFNKGKKTHMSSDNFDTISWKK